MKSRITFKKGKRYSGLMRLANTYKVNRDGKEIAVIQGLNNGTWFWYATDVNTYETPKSLEDCKADVKKFFQDKP